MKYLLVPLLALPLLGSCASIMTGSTDTVSVVSVPSGAYFSTNTGVRGYTPMNVSVPASQDLVVDLRLKGYESQSVVVESRMSGWIFGNLIFGGLIGIAIDAVNPDSRTHDSQVQVQLVKAEGPVEDVGAQEQVTNTQPVDFPEPPPEIDIRHFH